MSDKIEDIFSNNKIKVKRTKENRIAYIYEINNKILFTGDVINLDLYQRTDKKWKKIHKKGDTLFGNIKDEKIYFLEEDIPLLKKYIEDNKDKIYNIEEFQTQKIDKSKSLYNNLNKSTASLLESPTREKVKEVKNYISTLIEVVSTENTTLEGLTKLMSHDYATYTHSTNVSIYSMLLAKHLNESEEFIFKIGQGSILHDIGKSFISNDIVNKPGKLTDGEYREMKTHPRKGYDYLRSIGETDSIILNSVIQHHEDYYGTGYPLKLKGDRISLEGKIIGIVDVFDALTTKRSYKNPMTTFDALVLMKKQMSHRFDSVLFKKFIEVMSTNM